MMKRTPFSVRCLSCWLIALVLLGLAARPASADAPITVVSDTFDYEFKGPMTFHLEAKSNQPITQVSLFYRIASQTAAHKVDLRFDPSTTLLVDQTEDMSDPDNYQPPMITFTYWWVIENQAGDRLKTDPSSFVYEDTRFTWQVLEGEHVRLYWHDQDQEFGQTYFDIASRAAADLASEFNVSPKDPVAIVIYNSHEELMSVLQEASAEWTGAVNFGKSGCIAVELGSPSWMEKVLPHELTHAMLEQITQPPFGDIPRWLHEGLAMRSEGGMSLEEQTALAQAIQGDTLISLRVLNSPFADQRERAILSYAESNSLVSFIIEEYGTEKLGELIAVFAAGAHYDDAMIQVFGVDMDGMEDLWRSYIGAPPRQGITRATPVQATATIETLPAKTSTPAPVSQATTTPASTPTPAPTSRPCLPCLGPLFALALLALIAWPRLK
jgi:hypothetical protein